MEGGRDGGREGGRGKRGEGVWRQGRRERDGRSEGAREEEHVDGGKQEWRGWRAHFDCVGF